MQQQKLDVRGGGEGGHLGMYQGRGAERYGQGGSTE